MDGSKEIILARGHGYQDKDGKLCMIKCFACGRENYAPAVASGLCAFCGYNPNEIESQKKEILEHLQKDPLRKLGI